MMHAKAYTQPKPKIVDIPKHEASEVTMMTDSLSAQDRIRERAYELYERRGHQAGQDEQDWLRAEQEILNRRR